jgi:hypothetical protein
MESNGINRITKKSSGQFKASRFLRSKKARPFKLRADFGVIDELELRSSSSITPP